jgi:hypothetical protein
MIAIDWHEVDILISQLYTYDINYLIGNGDSTDQESRSIEPVQLLRRLVSCGFPLVENACISLFILHPELVSPAQEALQQGTEVEQEALSVLILATLYMQEWWLFRLALALNRLPRFQKRHLSLYGKSVTYRRQG